MSWQTQFGLVAALIIGLLNTTGIPVPMCLSPVALVLCSLQTSRRMAAFVIGAYYLGCAWPVCVVLHNYYGTIGALVLAPIVCAVITSLLAVPFMLAWSPLSGCRRNSTRVCRRGQCLSATRNHSHRKSSRRGWHLVPRWQVVRPCSDACFTFRAAPSAKDDRRPSGITPGLLPCSI